MRFLVDECVGPSVVRWLRENNHDAFSAYEDCRGWEDERILEKACTEGRIIVTMDKDFELDGFCHDFICLSYSRYFHHWIHKIPIIILRRASRMNWVKIFIGKITPFATCYLIN
ncbi:DUF5615 family PIN-like protein [Methanothrix sp.]|jgi:hypothetical protein|uniref:DUF5615 family PIN-like protein n=1 Tax=Methanothrix sp. TaxID=90426 RepID=UPI001BD352A8